MTHNFEHSLQHEREQATRADKFYTEVLKASEIKRYNSDSELDMAMQRQDVDVLLTINGINYKVSEKFRDKDFGDLYIEVYSKYPQTMGWLHTGSPNAILYFTPKNVYWITHKSLAAFCLNKLFPLISKSWYQELFQSHNTIESKKIYLDNDLIKINLIQAHNSPTEGNDWETIGISIAFSVLKQNAVKIKTYQLNSL